MAQLFLKHTSCTFMEAEAKKCGLAVTALLQRLHSQGGDQRRGAPPAADIVESAPSVLLASPT